MRYMGLDLGDATIGIAFSDALGITAQPFETYMRKTNSSDIDYLVDLVVERGIDLIVLGLPMHLDGSEGPQAEKTRTFYKQLSKKLKYSDRLDRKVGVELFDERFSSAEADKILKIGGLSRLERSKKIDALASSIILQAYMEMKKNEVENVK